MTEETFQEYVQNEFKKFKEAGGTKMSIAKDLWVTLPAISTILNTKRPPTGMDRVLQSIRRLQKRQQEINSETKNNQ